MTRCTPPFTPQPRFWNDWQLACRLGCAVNTMKKRIAELDGFPQKDKHFGWDSVAIEAWLDRRAGLIADIAEPANDTDQWETVINGIDKDGIRQHLSKP